MIQEGMKIKTFPDTDVTAYLHWIRSQGFNCYKVEDGIRIGSRIRPADYNSELTAKCIKKHMKEKRISKKEVARCLMTTENTVWQWVYGRRIPSPYFRQDLLDLLGITPEEWESCRE